MDALVAARRDLDAMKAKLPPGAAAAAARVAALDRRYHELAAGVYADARPAGGTEVGFAWLLPLLVPGGKLLIGLAGATFAAAGFQYASNLRDETALALRELEERAAASREGRTLPPSTLPQDPPEPPKRGGGIVGWLLLGGLTLGTVAVAVPLVLKHRRAG
jgi:hypothetical protein